MTTADIERTVSAFARAATLALEAGYDGVEIMASEGYLLNQFSAPATNRPPDAAGGAAKRARRFPAPGVAPLAPTWSRPPRCEPRSRGTRPGR
ncbi:hypothetical protein [Micrococcus sp. HSID17245]|uniref:oxidoreductase n=1 Tax=Micrococcus sp. HSID17245 TaxID=2419508 RepID=UPI0026AAB82E